MNAWRPLQTRLTEVLDFYQPNSYAVSNLRYNALFNPLNFPYGARAPAPFAVPTFANQLCSRFPGI